MKTEQQQYIINAVHVLVGSSGKSVASSTLTQSGIATRKELRKLERDGLLKVHMLYTKRGTIKTYYTEGVVRYAARPKEARYSQPSEEHNKG